MSTSGDDLTGAGNRLDDLYEYFFGEDDPDPLDGWATRTIVTTMLPLLAGLALLQMVSGSVLDAFEETLLVHPALLILVPVQIGTAGNLASIMCARLSTQLHLGTFELDPANPGVRANALGVLGLAATVFFAVGIAAWAIGLVLGGDLALLTVLTVSMISGMALAVLVVVLSLVSVWGSFRLGYNPDDTTIPLVTNVCDVSGVLILFAVASVVI
ncbi:MAG: magnesium transporter [Halalkalicoccus sp.]